jgi:hypothetical protein
MARRRTVADQESFVAPASWRPDKRLAKTCADFSDLAIGPDGCLYLLSDKSFTMARLDGLPPTLTALPHADHGPLERLLEGELRIVALSLGVSVMR